MDREQTNQEMIGLVTIAQTCTGCGACAADCVSRNITIKEGRAVVMGECMQCGHCVAVCPVGAAAVPEYEMADVRPYDTALEPGALLRTLKSRRSIRSYQPRPVEREKLDFILQAGRYSATAVNSQGNRFIVVQERLEELKTLVWDGIGALLAAPEPSANAAPFAEMYAQKQADPNRDFLFRNAPAVIYIANERAWDAGMASQSMELAAVAQGLGMLYNGFLRRAAEFVPGVADWLGAEGKPLAACMLLGYPAARYLRTAPRKAADVVWK